MFDIQAFRGLLPKKLKYAKIEEQEQILGYKYYLNIGYNENDQFYTITRDENGNLHLQERHLEEEQRAIYAWIHSIGQDMTLSNDPSFHTGKQEDETITQPARKEIILTPAKIGYSSITIKCGNETYSIINRHGEFVLLHNDETVEIDLNQEKEGLDLLRKPFEISIVDTWKMRRAIRCNNNRLNYVAMNDMLKGRTFLGRTITDEIIREWGKIEN